MRSLNFGFNGKFIPIMAGISNTIVKRISNRSPINIDDPIKLLPMSLSSFLKPIKKKILYRVRVVRNKKIIRYKNLILGVLNVFIESLF